jgi:hypothetical protein
MQARNRAQTPDGNGGACYPPPNKGFTMTKIPRTFRLETKANDMLETLHKKTGKEYTQILEIAIRLYYAIEYNNSNTIC